MYYPRIYVYPGKGQTILTEIVQNEGILPSTLQSRKAVEREKQQCERELLYLFVPLQEL